MAITRIGPSPDVMLTEDQAINRECPLIRYCANEIAVANEGATAIHAHANCRASQCVGWRWGRGPGQKVFVTYNGKIEEQWSWNPTGAAGYEGAIVRVVTEPARGFCGYAGPQ